MTTPSFNMKYYFFSLLIPLVCGLRAGTLDQRVTVVEYKDGYFGFLTNGGQLYSTTSLDSKQWGQWVIVNISTGSYPPMISNPVSTIDEHTGVIVVYVQASDGQAYGFFLESQNTFKVTKISSSIPCTKSRDEFSLDGIKFIKLHNRTHLFVRSQTNHSRIHYGYQEWSKGVWSSFDGIADDDNHLKYDFEI